MKTKRIVLYFILVIIFIAFNFYLRPIKGNSLVTDKYKSSSKYINGLYMSDEYFKSKLLSKDEYHIYEGIIKGSFENETTVTIDCSSDCDSAFTRAYNSVYLDHPELISFQGIVSHVVENNKITYNNYQNMGKIKSTLGAMRIEREMENIRHDTKDMSDKEKIIFVYNYVASHNYDRFFTYNGSNQSAYSFFTKESSVCAGFAKASQIIFQNIGIKSFLVLSSDHMWNYVEYEGKYYIFDATVGASFTDKTVKEYYDGLGRTTTEDEYGNYPELYPSIETSTTLRKLFNL